MNLQSAIFRKDVEKIRQLIEQGADVNEQGEGGVTPLYLAMLLDTDPRPFEILLANGANPNVHAHRTGIGNAGLTVAHLASMTSYNRLFELVFRSTGDPNISSSIGSPTFNTYSQPDGLERLALLAKKGGDMNYRNGRLCGNYLADRLYLAFFNEDEAVRKFEYELAAAAIKHGADIQASSRPRSSYMDKSSNYINGNFQPIHYLALSILEGNEIPEQGTAARKVLDHLEQNGLSLEHAIEELRERRAEMNETKRLDDATEASFTKWLVEISNDKEKEIRKKWDDPKWRIKRLPVSTFPAAAHSQHQIFRWQDHYWSDIVKSELIHKYLFEKWSEVKIFDDPKVASLKQAMFARDIPEMKRLIDVDQVDVNTLGKDNLTLLYLSLGIDDDPRPFELLIESGANPNIPNQANHKQKGLAVVHVVAKSLYCRHFKTVFELGGDSNLKAMGRTAIGYIPFDCFDWVGRVEFLCEQGADINQATSVPIVQLIASDWLNNTPKKSGKRSRKPLMLMAIKQGANLDFKLKTWLQSPRLPEKGVKPKIGKCALELSHILIEKYAPFRIDAELKSKAEERGFSFEKAEVELKEWRRLIAYGKSPLRVDAELEKKKNLSLR